MPRGRLNDSLNPSRGTGYPSTSRLVSLRTVDRNEHRQNIVGRARNCIAVPFYGLPCYATIRKVTTVRGTKERRDARLKSKFINVESDELVIYHVVDR